jgi:hypothetical protein
MNSQAIVWLGPSSSPTPKALSQHSKLAGLLFLHLVQAGIESVPLLVIVFVFQNVSAGDKIKLSGHQGNVYFEMNWAKSGGCGV